MTYTYRLSRRLAVLRAVVLGALAALAVVSCSGDDATDPLSPSLAVSGRGGNKDSGKPRISPDTLALTTDQVGKFVAYATSRGDSMLVQVAWSATGGTITSTGEFTSKVPGTFRVVARRSWKGQLLSDTSTVAVAAPDSAAPDTAMQIVRLIISPDTATVPRGGSKKFAAVAVLSDSSRVATAAIAWSATGGTVDSTGTFTADTVPGHFRVAASSTTGSLTDTAAVVVPAPDAPSLARVVLTPASAAVLVGQSLRFAAYGRLSTGDSVTVSVSYSATGGTITSAGLYTATAVGNGRVVAVQQGGVLADTSLVVVGVAAPAPTTHAGYQVTPGGSSGGDGSANAPWSLAYALSGAGGRIVAGDTVWLRGGTYPSATLTSTLTGTSSAPIVVRQWPGERATVTGILQIKGADTWYMDFEHANSSFALNTGSSIDLHGPRVKLIGLTIHDGGGNGVGVWSDAPNAEVAGCTIYNNGWNAPAGGGGYGHGIYVQSTSPNTAVLRDNAIYDNYAFGIHGYTEGGSLSGIQMLGNAVWNSGVPGPREPLPNLFVGSGTQSANRIVVRSNMLFLSPSFAGSGNRMAEFGYGSQNADIVVDSNVIVNGNVPLHLNNWGTARVQENQIVSSTGALTVDGAHSGYTWGGNEWIHNPSDAAWRMDGTARTFAAWQSAAGTASSDVATGSMPTGQQVFVRANPYEPGRGLVVVYNWSGAGSATVDLSSIARGRTVEVRHAHAPLGASVASGSGVVTLPMTNVAPPTPLPGWTKPVPVTGPAFNVFVVSAP